MFIALVALNFLHAQSLDDSLLTLQHIFSDNLYNAERMAPSKWLADGQGYTTLERAEDGKGSDIVQYDCKSGERKILVPAKNIIPAGEEKPLQIRDYSWSIDQTKLLIFTNTQRVWRYHTRGDYWVIDLKTWQMHQLGRKFKPSTLMFATFSPYGEKAAYVCERNVYLEDLKNQTITPLTKSTAENIVNGTSDWVYEEEFGLRNGIRWSPDSKKIAYWQFDTEGVGTFNLINNTDSIYSRIIPLPYPKVGTTNSSCRVGVIDTDSGETTWLDVPGDPRNNYIPRMEWAASSKEVILQQINRLQNTNNVILGNATTGNVKTIYTDRDSAWLDVVDDWKWLKNGKEFTWVSEQDGWRHIYRITRDGKDIKLVTRESYDITEILGIDDKAGWIYFMASPENATQRYLYRIRLNGESNANRLSPAAQAGTHHYNIAPNFKWAFHTFSKMDNPPITELISLPDHKTIRVMIENKELKEKLESIKRLPTEFFTVSIEKNVSLDGYKILPYNFDKNKKYPVLFFVYGEPAGQTVLDQWGGSRYLWHTMLAQNGYVIISVDPRGTPGPNGRAWRKSIYGQIGILASADHAAANRIIRKWSFVDSTRIAIWGWSGGGSMSLNAIFRYPDLYQTAMAIAFVSNQRLYDTIYQERYMGLPETNPEGYKNGSPVNFAKNLRGNLLLMHGTGDDNVHYQSAEVLINELIKQNKMFTMVPYPNRSHGLYEGENSTRHVWETLTWYLKEHMPAGPVE
ncbi:MAG: S9 family peptidase [Deferribacteres bacterium]|nr:S9 family peptidase [candidate division KSB1 bacterium]MCB9502050.1 S9 family peptidase [Deferribacteres bacterium]